MNKITLIKGTQIVKFPENQIEYMKIAGWKEVKPTNVSIDNKVIGATKK